MLAIVRKNQKHTNNKKARRKNPRGYNLITDEHNLTKETNKKDPMTAAN